MTSYLSDVAKKAPGHVLTQSPADAMETVHDIFAASRNEGLDVWMLCGSLRWEVRDDYYYKITRKTFADSVKEVLARGRNVSIFIWNDPRKDNVISAAMWKLVREASNNPSNWGVLDVRASGTSEGAEAVQHFIVARSPWLMRDSTIRGCVAESSIPSSFSPCLTTDSWSFES